MQPADIAAYIGAAAWLPQIGSWIYNKYAKPNILINASGVGAEVGYSTFGPIVNCPFGFAASRKSIVARDFSVTLTHEQGDSHKLVCVGTREGQSELLSGNNRSVFFADAPPTLVQIGSQAIVDKLFRFQEQLFKERRDPVWYDLRDMAESVSGANVNKIQMVRNSPQYAKLRRTTELAFWWKPGRYEMVVDFKSDDAFVSSHSNYHFTLDEFTIERLKKNFTVVQGDFDNQLFSNIASYKQVKTDFYWANIALIRAT